MFLHIGDGRVIPQEDILAILPIADESDGDKSRILLAGGGEARSPISSVTLRRRLDEQEALLREAMAEA